MFRGHFAIFTLAAFLSACGSGQAPAQPDLPQSVAPGWNRKAYAASSPPQGLPPGATPACWKADYAGAGSAEIWLCGYKGSEGAFDAVQRARAEADTVKFQEGRYLAIVKWSGANRTDVTALVRAIQKNLQVK